MLTRFVRLITGGLGSRRPLTKPPAQALRTQPQPSENRSSQPGTPIYPPVDQGIELAGASAILASQSDLLRRLKLLLGISEAEFQDRYLSVVRGLASYIDLLPASESGTHKGAGGLFRLALEMSFYSRQSCEAVLFAGKVGVENRRELEPRWRYATFLAALCCELHRLLSQMIVLSEDGREWPVHQVGLTNWLQTNHTKRYYVRWIKEGEAFSAGSATLVASKIIPESAMQYLQQGHHSIIAAMLEAIASDGKRSKGNQIAEIVEKIRKKVAERDEALAPSNYGKLTVGSQLEPYLIDAMRRLVSDGTWAVNQKKARVWYGTDGLFIVWRTAAKEITEALSREAVTGIPRDASTIAEILQRAGVLAADGNGDFYWKIKTPLSDSELITVKVAKPESLLVVFEEEERPQPLDARLCVTTAQVHSKTSAPTPRPQETEVRDEHREPAASEKPEVVQIRPPQKQEQSEELCEPEEDAPKPKAAAKAKKPAERKERQPEGPGAIKVVEEVQHEELLPEDLSERMSVPVRETVNAIANDLRAGKLNQSSRLVDEGLAISAEQVALYGFELLKVVTELHRLGWLYEDPAKPSRKLHKMPLPSGTTEAVVFKTQAAIDLRLIDA